MIRVTTLSRLVEEYTRATSKHDWTGYTLDQMLDAVYGEDFELGEAHKREDVHGQHGIIAEAMQGIVTRIRLIEALSERSNPCATP